MGDTKKHICESCGGALKIDAAKQLYVCPFCGMTFDYAYFKEDDVFEKAETFASRGEYAAAIDAYEFYLTKDPHSVRALEKIMLLKYEITDLEKIRMTNVLKFFKGKPKTTEYLIEQAEGEGRERLEKISGIIGKAAECHRLHNDMTAIDREIKDCQRVYDEKDKSALGMYVEEDASDPENKKMIDPHIPLKKYSVVYNIIMACLAFALLAFCFLGPMYVCGLILAIGFGIGCDAHARLSVLKKKAADVDSCRDQMQSMQKQIGILYLKKNKLQKQFDEIREGINALLDELAKEEVK
jgi:hypothetical protein